jgi:copper chaperone NosL
MTTRRAFIGLIGAAGLAAVAASAKLLSTSSAGERYPEIHYGEEPCGRCRMIIDDHRFATGWIHGDDGEAHFDDIGCAALAASERRLAGTVPIYVHDFSTEAWLDARDAAFVISPAIHTPMAYGVAAVSGPEAATSLAGTVDGRIARWDELAALLGEIAPTHEDGHGA